MNDFKIETKTNKTQNEIQFHFGALTRIREGKFVIPFERKTDFDDCRSYVDYKDLSITQKIALKKISSMVISKFTSSFDYIFPSNEEDNELVYLVSRANKTFIVNNEGFGYSRYIIELRNY
jgi:hypothetical protein